MIYFGKRILKTNAARNEALSLKLTFKALRFPSFIKTEIVMR